MKAALDACVGLENEQLCQLPALVDKANEAGHQVVVTTIGWREMQNVMLEIEISKRKRENKRRANHKLLPLPDLTPQDVDTSYVAPCLLY